MAEPVNDSAENPQPQPPRKELSMETRLLLAFLLMGAVLFTTPYFYKSVAPPAKKAATPTGQTAASPPPAGGPAVPAAAPPAPAPVVEPMELGDEATPQQPAPPFV